MVLHARFEIICKIRNGFGFHSYPCLKSVLYRHHSVSISNLPVERIWLAKSFFYDQRWLIFDLQNGSKIQTKILINICIRFSRFGNGHSDKSHQARDSETILMIWPQLWSRPEPPPMSPGQHENISAQFSFFKASKFLQCGHFIKLTYSLVTPLTLGRQMYNKG